MKIIYISSEDMRKEGGGKTHFFEVARNLVALGNELLILLPGYRPRDKKNYGLNVRYVPTLKKSPLSYLLYEIVGFFYLAFYILKFRPDAIYLRQGLFEVFTPILARLFRVPYVIEKNGIMEDELRSRGFAEITIKLLRAAEEVNFHLSNKIICVTEGIKREIARRYRVDESKLVVIPNGANIDLFRPLDKRECRRKLRLEEDAFYVGFVGSFAPWQGLETLIEAAKQVKEQGYSQIKYILVGDGEQEPILRQKVQKYNLEQVIQFTGRVAYEQVVNYINAFDVCYLCIKEMFHSPLKLYEYLACGRPAIASRVDGVREVIEEGQCGYLSNAGDAEELAKRIIQSYQEREALQEMGLRGRRLVEDKYTWRATAERIVEVLDEVIKEKSGQVRPRSLR
ncbi:MAG: glycosyltransferase family 4 protein [Candidatus Methanomethyliaceae archaeon]